jgi:hypothetical protein
MSSQIFKSISPQQLEAAIASAISALTTTDTKVELSGWHEKPFEPMASWGKDRYELQLSVTVGQHYGGRRCLQA